MSLTFNKLRKANSVRSRKMYPQCQEWGETDWGCALAGEAGELCNMFKKRKRGTKSKKVNLEACGKEIADIVLYCDLAAEHLGLSLEEIITQKFNEKSKKMGVDIFL